VQIFNPISQSFDLVSEWWDELVPKVDWTQECPRGFLKQHDKVSVYISASNDIENGARSKQEYGLPIAFTNNLLALIQFRLRTGENISDEQKLMLESVEPEIALALKANQEQKKLFELRQTQLALSERHAISNYLHDNLSPNLAFLNLKIDQFIAGEAQQTIDHGVSELRQMKTATNQSYDIVRKIIETIHTETTPHLINLIDAHIKKVSKRSKIDISLEKRGRELPALPETQKAVFNVFQEAINNVERHSQANSAKVLVEWGESDLTVKISDDGVGFDPQTNNASNHLGMVIMRERIESVNGQVEVTSTVKSGTEVNIFVPLESN